MSRLLSRQKVLIKLNAFNKLMPRLKKKETVKLHLKLSSLNRTQINANKKKKLKYYHYSLGPGSALGEKVEKYRRGSKKKSASEASRVVVWGVERVAEPGDMPVMLK